MVQFLFHHLVFYRGIEWYLKRAHRIWPLLDLLEKILMGAHLLLLTKFSQVLHVATPVHVACSNFH